MESNNKKFSDVHRWSGEHSEPMRIEMPESRFKKLFKKSKNLCLACWPGSWKNWLILLLALVVLWKLAIWFGFLPSLTFPAVNQNKWQAVFITNGQVYFGHLRELNKEYAVLKNVYYLRQDQQQPNLVKLGSEIHGPEDIMHVPKEQIVFWENMRNDSPVVKAIQQQEASTGQATSDNR